MAEEQQGQERTEQPTAKRLTEARKKGQVARFQRRPDGEDAALVLAVQHVPRAVERRRRGNREGRAHLVASQHPDLHSGGAQVGEQLRHAVLQLVLDRSRALQ